MRAVCLIAGSVVMALTATKALRHVVMVPVDRPVLWFASFVLGFMLLGVAVMPKGE